MFWKRYWPIFYIFVFFIGSLYIDLHSQKISSRRPASFSLAKSCKQMIAKFIEKEKVYTLPTYSVATLSYKKSTKDFIEKLKLKTAKKRYQSIIKLNEYRGSSRELTESYVNLLNQLRKKNIIGKNSLKKILRHINENSIPLATTGSGKVYVPKRSRIKLMGASDLLDKVLRKREYSNSDIKKYKKVFSDITEEELMLVKSSFSSDREEMTVLRRFIQYSRTLPENDRLLALDHAHEIYLETSEKKIISNFNIEKNKFNKFRKKQKDKFLKGHKVHSKKILKQADNHANDIAKLYEKLYYSCNKTSSTKTQLQASKTYGKYILTLGPVSAGTSYSIVNWDKEKDEKWFKGIAYDITLATFLNFYAGKLLTGPGEGHLKKLAKSMGFYGSIDLMTAPLYNKIFSPSEDERSKALKTLVSDEKQREELSKFIKYIKETDHDDSIEESLLSLVKNEDGSAVTKADLSSINKEDLLTEDLKDTFLKLLAKKMYDENKGDWISSGNQGLDRFWFHRAWDITSFPLDLYANMLIFKKLCVTVNPARAKFEAALLFLSWRAINDAGYYYFRDESINQ